jgi:hypothetical protein
MKFLMPTDEQLEYVTDQSDDPDVWTRYIWEDGAAKGIMIGLVIGVVFAMVIR